jgi:hypothetical protein
MADKLSRILNINTIHTDLFYSPEGQEHPKSTVGIEGEAKIQYIQSQRKLLKRNTILEGAQLANSKELGIWIKYLEADGLVIIFEAVHPKALEYLIEKYDNQTDRDWCINYYKELKDIQPDKVVSSTNEILNFLKERKWITTYTKTT